MLGISYGDDSMNLFDQFLLLIVIEMHVPLRKAGLASSILDQYETNLKHQMKPGWNIWSEQGLVMKHMKRTGISDGTYEVNRDQWWNI